MQMVFNSVICSKLKYVLPKCLRVFCTKSKDSAFKLFFSSILNCLYVNMRSVECGPHYLHAQLCSTPVLIILIQKSKTIMSVYSFFVSLTAFASKLEMKSGEL